LYIHVLYAVLLCNTYYVFFRWMCLNTQTHTHIYIYAYIYMYTYAYIYTYLYNTRVNIYIYIYLWKWTILSNHIYIVNTSTLIIDCRCTRLLIPGARPCWSKQRWKVLGSLGETKTTGTQGTQNRYWWYFGESLSIYIDYIE
jgi:hypothetical protein